MTRKAPPPKKHADRFPFTSVSITVGGQTFDVTSKFKPVFLKQKRRLERLRKKECGR